MDNLNTTYNIKNSRHISKFSVAVTFLLTLFILGSYPTNAQHFSSLQPNKKTSQYILKYWNTESGLTSESTNDLIQTNDGYIWIGTYTGLHRFDGANFTVYTSNNSNLPSPNVLRMDTDKNGRLWLGTLHGICTYQNGEFIVPESLKAVKNYSIETLLSTQNGGLWFSTKSNHLFYYTNNTLFEYTDTFNIRNTTVLSIAEAPNGTIYFGTDASDLILYNIDKTYQQIEISKEVNGINKITASKNAVYIATGKGVYNYTNTQLSKLPFLENTTVNSLIEDHSGTLWMGTMQGLYRYIPEGSSLDSITELNGLPNNIIRDLHFDDQGNLWGGTYRNGFFLLFDGSITSYDKNNGLSSDVITAITEIAPGKIILGDESGQLNLLENDIILPFETEINIPYARLKHLFTDSKNRLWVSTYGGLVLLDGENSRIYNIESGFPDNFIREVYEDSHGIIWVGSKNAGLIKLNGLDDWEVLNIEKDLTSNYIMSITENNKNQLVVGTISGINYIENMKVVKTITLEDGLPSNFSFATLPTDKYLWIASNDGLTAYSEEKTAVFNTMRGMPSNIVYDLMSDKQGNIWIPSEKGILMASIADLERLVDQPTEKIKLKEFNKSHGMKNNHCLGGVHSYTDSKSNLWIPTQGGIVFLKPEEVKSDSLKVKLILQEILADNQKVLTGTSSLVPANTHRLSINFTGIDYQNNDNLQFRYKLSPFDDNWITAGQERTATYTNLTHDDYQFELQVGINDQYTASTIQHIKIEAAWWQTVWAKFIFIIGVISLGTGIYFLSLRALTARNINLERMVRARTSELEIQKQELKVALEELSTAQEKIVQSEKMASLGVLSAGVAHEINNPLNFIHGGLIGLEEYFKVTNTHKSKDLLTLLNAISEGVSRTTNIVASLNEFSYQHDNSKAECDIHHITDNCLVILNHLIKDKIIINKEYTDSEVRVVGNSGKLHQVFLNILTNAIQAIKSDGEIKIKTWIHDNKFMIDIQDNGRGIPPENLTKVTEPFFTTKSPGKGTGMGLSIAYNFILEHKGDFRISSYCNEGTTVSISLPIG